MQIAKIKENRIAVLSQLIKPGPLTNGRKEGVRVVSGWWIRSIVSIDGGNYTTDRDRIKLTHTHANIDYFPASQQLNVSC